MPPYAILQFLTLLTFSTFVRSQFEFNDQETVYDVVVDSVPICEVSCVAILRPPDQNPAQKSAIDRLTFRLATEYSDPRGEAANRRPSVMSYNTELYEKFYMDPNKRQKDTCISWITVVMVNNSTNEQLAYLSESYFFDRSYWILFLNRSELATVFQNMNMRLSSRFFIVLDIGNGRMNITSIGPFGEKIGYVLWTKKDGVTIGTQGFYPKMKGSTLKVGALVFPPYLMANRNQSGHITSVTGFHGAIWNDLQETLKFNSVYVEPEGCIYGSYNEKGNWTGLYRLIARKEADVLINGLTISTERHQIVDFLHPIEKTNYKLFYEKGTEIFDWLKVFRPLHYLVWIALVIWIIVGGLAAYLVTSVEKNFQTPRRHFSLISCIYFVLRALCNQGSEQVPKLWALRIFFITSYLIAALILPSYSASLISALTVKTPIEPLKELTDVLVTDLEISIESNSTDYDFFEKTSDPIFQEIFKTSVIKYDGYQIEYREAIEKACVNKKALFFGALNELQAILSEQKFSCVLLPLQSTISPAYQTMAVAKHSEYRMLLKTQLLRMIEYGLVDRQKQLFLANLNGQSLENDIGIGLIDVGAIFIYFGMLIVLSVGIFFLEHLSWRYGYKTHLAPYRLTKKQEYLHQLG